MNKAKLIVLHAINFLQLLWRPSVSEMEKSKMRQLAYQRILFTFGPQINNISQF